jgi:hypothetical protein
MGFNFLFLFILSAIWYYAGYEILLRIERAYYRSNWEKNTKDISWLHKSNILIPYSSRRAYYDLAGSWLFSTPAWARDHRAAYRLIWCWRIGHVIISLLMLYLFFGPLVKDVLL